MAPQVRARTSRSFVPPPTRELLAQHSAECNMQPLPLLVPRQRGVRLPPPEDCLPDARSIVRRGLADAGEPSRAAEHGDLSW